MERNSLEIGSYEFVVLGVAARRFIRGDGFLGVADDATRFGIIFFSAANFESREVAADLRAENL